MGGPCSGSMPTMASSHDNAVSGTATGEQQAKQRKGDMAGGSKKSGGGAAAAANDCTNGTRRMDKGEVTAEKQEEEENGHSLKKHALHKTRWYTYACYILLLVISKYSLPDDLQPSKPSILHVWYYGWITAISTGLGAVPLMFASELGKQMLGMSNAIACGMMVSASYSLVMEGVYLPPDQYSHMSESVRVLLGVVAGLLFIVSTKRILDRYEDIHLGELHGMDAKKVLLIVFVMTLHSFSEGVGIGVSFGGATGSQLGFLISATLAVHNVPEGLAVALVLSPRGISKANTGLWCIFTSLPQPLMAVPAFLFVEQFLPVLPVGLGFAAGAMFYVACFELFADAVQDTSRFTAIVTSSLSFFTMLYLHDKLEEEL